MTVLRHYEVPEGAGLKKRVNCYYGLVCIFFIFFLSIPLIPSLAPVCSNIRVYPSTLNSSNLLFLLNAFYFWIMFTKNFFFKIAEKVKDWNSLTQP